MRRLRKKFIQAARGLAVTKVTFTSKQAQQSILRALVRGLPGQAGSHLTNVRLFFNTNTTVRA